MSIWKDQGATKKDTATLVPEPSSPPEREAPVAATFSPTVTAPAVRAAAAEREPKESLIAADLTIEGKIEGTGHVRIAGKFNGDVNVQGNLTIETGAKLTGGVRAQKVIVAGELEGNIESAQKVEVLASGALIGDVKAGSLTVAAGARMRGIPSRAAALDLLEDFGMTPLAIHGSRSVNGVSRLHGEVCRLRNALVEHVVRRAFAAGEMNRVLPVEAQAALLDLRLIVEETAEGLALQHWGGRGAVRLQRADPRRRGEAAGRHRVAL